MNIISNLYEKNDTIIDFTVYRTIPFFNSLAKWSKNYTQEGKELLDEFLSESAQIMFRDLIYEKTKEIDCDKNDVIDLYDFLHYIDYLDSYIPLFIRYFYKNRKDPEFMKATALLHRNNKFMGITKEELYKIIAVREKKDDPESLFLEACLEKDLNVKLNLFKVNYEKYRHADSLYMYSTMLISYFGSTVREAYDLLLENWNTNKHVDSYFTVIFYERNELARMDLYKMLWETYNHIDSLREYANILIWRDEKKGLEYLELNWRENNDMESLESHADFLLGKGYFEGEIYSKAVSLHDLLWDRYKLPPIKLLYHLVYTQHWNELRILSEKILSEKNDRRFMVEYAKCLLKSEEKEDKTKAIDLLIRNILLNIDIESVKIYIDCLENGIGCEKDPVKAKEIEKRYEKFLI